MIKHKIILLALAGWGWAAISGCAPAAVGGGAVAVGAVSEQRGADGFVEDNWVAMKIRTAYMNSEVVHLGNVNVSVYQGKVLLTGTAVSKDEVNEAIRLAREAFGVKEVRSELRVQFASAQELAEDAVISNQVKVLILKDKQVNGLDIHVETTKRVVYLTGWAPTVRERDRAVEIARGVAKVLEVVSYIDVREAGPR